MSEFFQLALESKPKTGLDWLSDWQSASRDQLKSKTFPTRKTEDWKYTNLRPLSAGAYCSHSVAEVQEAPANVLAAYDIDGLKSLNFVFVNGVYSEELSTSQALPAGLQLVRFCEANEQQREQIKQKLGVNIALDGHPFAALNSSVVEDGLFIQVEKEAVITQPIKLVYLSTPQAKEFSANVRTLVDLAAFSQATIVEHFISSDEEQNAFTNNVTELNVGENAKLVHYRLHEEEEHALHIGHVSCSLAKHANIESFHLAMGSLLQRIDIVVNHLGEGAHCQLNGVYLPSGQQLVDFHTCIEHAVPHCTTSETFRGIVSDSAKAVFNGRIHIHPQAQKTLAELSNKNLLTSDKAEVDTKPELEIYADDVQCAHGATVAQLDEKSIHYLQTRGISVEEAKVLLSFGFINELINTINDEPIINYLRPKLAALFARDPKLMRHIV